VGVISREPVVDVRNLHVRFGEVEAVAGVDLAAYAGHSTALLGRNGAGKSTTMRVVVGLTPPTSGSATVLGRSYADLPNPGREVGVLLDASAQHAGRTGRETLRVAARTMGLPTSRVDEMLELVSLTPTEAGRRVKNYSLGMRQRLGIATALIGDPEVLILDEPLNGADPRQRVHFKRLLQQLASEGCTIVLSSHILEEVEELAETVLLIVNGKLAASGGFRAIRAALNQRPYHVRVVCDAPRALASAVVGLPSVEAVHVDPDGAVVVLSRNVLDLQIELPRLAQSAGISLRRVEPLDDSLESVFGYLVEG
jgi:ABC-2 type transport system ATP-binding protein